MQAVFRRSGGGAEGLFEKRDTDACRAADFLECGRGPWLPFHHLREQRQSDTDDLALFGQSGDGLFEERFLFVGRFA